jgi:hypothetical protein
MIMLYVRALWALCLSLAWFERVQYREIRISLGIMCTTPNNSLGALSDIKPLAERFVHLNLRYFVAIFTLI